MCAAAPNLDQLGKTFAWFQADNQGRTYEDPAVWGCSLQGRVCNAVLDGKFAANVTCGLLNGQSGLAQTRQSHLTRRACGSTRRWPAAWRLTTILWARKTDSAKTAAGRKWARIISTGRRGMMRTWATRRSIANIGVVIGQSTQLLYPGPATARTRDVYARNDAGNVRGAAARAVCF